MDIKIKDSHLQTVIAFGSNGLPLGERSKNDLIDLGISARQSNSPTLLNLFETLPDLSDLQKAKFESTIRKPKISYQVEVPPLPKDFTGTDPRELRKI